MTAHDLAKEMTEKQANNVLRYWEELSSNKLAEVKSLIRLGDSKNLAVATIMVSEKQDSDLYEKAYCS